MITGKGTLILRGGCELAVEYQFGGDHDDQRAGYLLSNFAEVDPAVLCERLRLLCEDGTVVVLAVVHFSNRHLGVIGRVVPSGDVAA